MSSAARVLVFSSGFLGIALAASAQPAIFAFPSPPPNADGWMNTPAQVEFLCSGATRCGELVRVTQEGGGQLVEGTATDANGATASTTVTLNIDFTAPDVTIQAGHASTTAAASITVVARTRDALSGPKSAACNGRAAAIAEGGLIRCEVPLSIGANDVVVEVSDHADNSGSAGFRIVRTAAEQRLAVVPENIGLIVGQVTTVQVVDASGVAARDVVWQGGDPAVGGMSSDGRHVFTARAPGMVWLTASSGAATARLLITVYAGDRLPPGAMRWQIGTVMIMQTPDTQPLQGGDTVNVLSTRRESNRMTVVESINRTTGWLNWRAHSATAADETAVEIRQMPSGDGAILAFDTADGRSALVRTGTNPWRFQFPNRIRPEIVLTTDGSVLVMERTSNGVTQLIALAAETGRLRGRQSMPNGTHLALNVGCVKGANGARYVPAEVGPLNRLRVLQFAMVLTQDQEDFGVCNQVSGNYKRTIVLATMRTGENRVDPVATIEVSTLGSVPSIELFQVVVDRSGATLLPWIARDPLTGNPQFRVTRVAEDGIKEFKLPAAGKVWLSGRDDDIAITTDGFTVVGFNVVTGAILYAYGYEGGIEILGVTKGTAFINHRGKEIKLDVPLGPQR